MHYCGKSGHSLRVAVRESSLTKVAVLTLQFISLLADNENDSLVICNARTVIESVIGRGRSGNDSYGH